MPSHPHALIAAAAPLISLAAALPQHYISRTVNNVGVNLPDGLQSQIEASLVHRRNEPVSIEPKTDVVQTESGQGQCATHGEFTYYSERPLPGAEAESIVIEECDPSNPNQTRLAYVANKSIKDKLSPTSILIGCTSTSPNAFATRQDGAFTNVAGTYTNFVRRGVQPTGMGTLAAVAKKPNVVKKGPKRSEEEAEEVLVRRWESRSDIDQYSDGYHTCRSANSSACRLVMPKEVCPELEKALKGALPPVKAEEAPTLVKRIACSPEAVKDGKCPTNVLSGPVPLPKRAGLTAVKEDEPMVMQKRYACVPKGSGVKGLECPDGAMGGRMSLGGQSLLPKRAVGVEVDPKAKSESLKKEDLASRRSDSSRIAEDEHHEFMRRWLQGDEHPRSFMVRSDEESLEKRGVGFEDYHQFDRGDLYRSGNDGLHGRDYAEEVHHHDEHDSCDDRSDINDPHCAMKLRYAGLQQRRDLNGKQGEVQEVQMAARYYDSDGRSDCTDLSDQGRAECQAARAQGIRYVKRSKGLAKRSNGLDDQDDAGKLQKRWDGSDKNSVKSYDSHNSGSSRGRYRKRDVDGKADEALIKRSTGLNDKEDQLDKRSHHSGRSGRRRRNRSWHRRDLANEGDDALEKRSRHSGRSRKSWHRRDVHDEVEEDALDKRSHHSGGSRSSGDPYRGRSRSSDGRYRREVKVEIDVLGKRDVALPPGLADRVHEATDAATVRSALSERGDIFENGQDSYTEMLGKREEAPQGQAFSKRTVVVREGDESLQKRDLATSIWKMTVAPLLQRREVASSVTIFKRDVI